MKNIFLRQVGNFVGQTVLWVLFTGFGLIWLDQSISNSALSPQQIMTYQALGFSVSGAGFVHLLELWWGINTNWHIQKQLEAQSIQIKNLESQLVTTNALLQQVVDNTVLNHEIPETASKQDILALHQALNRDIELLKASTNGRHLYVFKRYRNR